MQVRPTSVHQLRTARNLAGRVSVFGTFLGAVSARDRRVILEILQLLERVQNSRDSADLARQNNQLASVHAQ